MSLLNFLLVQWNRLDAEYSWDFVRSSHLSSEAQELLLWKLEGISRRGHLADWGYAVPFHPEDVPDHTLRDDMDTKTTTPERDTQLPDAIPCQPTDAEAPSSPLTSLSSPEALEAPTSPIADSSDENTVPVRRLGFNGSESPHYVPISDLRHTHDITVPMGGDPVNPSRPSIDTNPLCHTVSSLQPNLVTLVI